MLHRLAGPRRSAKVVHAGRDAVYLEVDGACLGVLGARAVQVPCGVRTRRPSLPSLRSGEEGWVGGGAVGAVINGVGWEVRVCSVVDTAVPTLSDVTAAWGAKYLGRGLGARLDLGQLLPASALDRLRDGDPAAVEALLGRGPGLTPLGDDLLCGWLAAAAAVRAPALGPVREAATRAAPERTTLLSSTLLTCAARGEVVPEFRSVLTAIGRRDQVAMDRAVELLLGVGDSSGGGLCLGLALALAGAPAPVEV